MRFKFSRKHWNGSKFVNPSRKGDSISVFTGDISRILYSPAFRRLQNKTQVHPLPKSDNLRNRLTHTIEVANVGKLISSACAEIIVQSTKTKDRISTTDIVDITYAACLAHDIGNPPFGHTGEDAIGSWFADKHNISKFKILRHALRRKGNYLHFTMIDGNSLGFRVLTTTQGWKHRGGLRLSAAVLGAFSKYPFSAKSGKKLNKYGIINAGKYGYLNSEENLAKMIFNECGMDEIAINGVRIYARHPISYIMEAADDIAYLTTDIQDGHKHGTFDFKDAEALLLDCSVSKYRTNYDSISNRDTNGRIQYLRVACINTLSEEAINTYTRDFRLIHAGECAIKYNLLSSIDGLGREIGNIRIACNNELYYTKEKMSIEIGGHHVLSRILEFLVSLADEIYVKKINNPNELSKKNRNLWQILPKGHSARMLASGISPDGLLRLVCDLLCNMTDVYALDFYKTLTGSELP